MRIGVLTSSRADYGIYLPLLNALRNDSRFKLNLIVFGTHLSPFHGHTVNQILSDGFDVPFRIESVLAGDTQNSIASGMALASMKFAEFWNNHKIDFDLVFCLGDRYEMFAAISAAIPFGITFAHLHGGEKTLGAYDNIFRHAITLASKIHFVSCAEHGRRVAELIGSNQNIFNVGSLSLDNLQTVELYSRDEFLERFSVDLNKPTLLVTVHPETVAPYHNSNLAEETAQALLALADYQVLLTLPNADTNGSVLRHRFSQLPAQSNGRVSCHENLGVKGYFTAMKYCSMLVGNTSSGIIEAASFGKYTINLGTRQLGRETSDNVIHAAFNAGEIVNAVGTIKGRQFTGKNIYAQRNAAERIIQEIKKIYHELF